MGLFGNKIPNITMSTVEGSALQRGIKMQLAIKVSLLDDCIEFKEVASKQAPTLLKYSQIIKADIVTSDEIKEKSKSVVGGAIIGGLLLGGLGATIGAIDGATTKKEKKIHIFLVINYNESNGGQNVLYLESNNLTFGLEKFIKDLKVKCPNIKSEIQPNETKYL